MESPNPKQAAPPNARHDTGAGPDTQPSGAASTEKSALAFLAPPQAPDELGRLGPYRILGELGHGGMGMVFRAEDPQLKRQIALKVMLPQYAANPLAMKRFLREAEAQAAVEHDHIIPIFQVGEDRGTPFIAMPLLKGQTLAAALKTAPRLPVSEVIRIGREMAEGLAAAHEKGLIHRDIKPGNVWLEGERRRVKILDFGLARAEAEQSTEGDEPITASGTIVGTPSYMSPEQARALPVDFRTDLFSLGVVLYQMATGHLPFTGANTMAILTALAVDTPRPPRELNREIPATLNDLIQQLLAKNPSQRPHSAHAVAEDLRQHELAMSVAVQAIPLGALPEAVPEVWSQIADTETNEVVHRPAPAVRKPAPISREAQPSAPRRGTPIWVWAVAAVGFLAVVGGAVVVFQQVTKVTTPKGTLVIESSDPDVEVIVKKDGVVLVDKTKQREIELKVGDGYTIELAEKKDGLRLNTDKFSITKDGKSTVKVFVEKPVAAKPKEKPVADSDRRVAQWALDRGWVVVIRDAVTTTTRQINPGDQLPVGPWTLWAIGASGFDDAALVTLGEATNYGSLALANSTVTDEGIKRLMARPGFAKLVSVVVSSPALTTDGVGALRAATTINNLEFKNCPKIGDGVFKHLREFPNLDTLRLEQVPVTNGGLESLRGLKLKAVTVRGNLGITDDGLAHLQALRELTQVNVAGTSVTEAGVKKLAVALPRCKITWDGGTIEPPDLNKLAEADFPALEAKSKAAGVTFASFAKDVNDFKVKHGGTPAAIKAAELLMKLPSPLDALDPAKIPDDAKAAWKAAGFDGKDVVAVLGEHRGRQGGPARRVAFSSDGKVLVSGGEGGVWFWNSSNRQLSPLARDIAVTVLCVAISGEGKLAVGGGSDGNLFLWRIEGQSVRRLDPVKVDPAAVWSVAFSPDGKTLVTGGSTGLVRLWTVTEQGVTPRSDIQAHTDWVYELAFTPNGKLLASASRDKTVALWDVSKAKAEECARLKDFTDEVFSVAISGDAKTLVAGSGDKSVRVWDLDGDRTKVRAVLTGQDSKVYAVAVSMDGKQVFFGGHSGKLSAWCPGNEPSTPAVLIEASNHTMRGLAVSQDSSMLSSASENGTIRLWDVATGKELHPLTGPVGAATSVAWSPDGAHLAVAGADLTARYWNVAERRIDGTIPLQPSAYPPQVRFTPAGDAIAISSPLALWSTNDKKLTKTYALGASSLAISPDGRRIAGTRGEGGTTVWDVASGSQVVNVAKHLNPLGVAFDATGTRLATGWTQVGIYDAATGSPVAEPTLQGMDLRDLAFSPNGALLYGQNAYLDLRTLQYQSTGAAVFCGFSPDGRLFASRTGNMLAIHDTAQPSVQQKFNFPGPITGAAFAPDGRHIATANTNGTVYILRLPKPQVMAPEPAALAFDGKTTHVRLPFSPTDAAPYTVEAWVKFDTPTSEQYAGLASAYNPGRGISLFRYPEGTIGFGERVGQTLDIPQEAKPSGQVGWMHVAGVWDGKESRLYVNGVKQPHERNDKLPQKQIDAQNQPWMLGASQPVPGEPVQNFFAGQMREVRFSMGVRYDKDFTPATRHEPDKETYALYRCDDGQGDELKDLSGGNRHGKITGATWVSAGHVPTPEQVNAATALGVPVQVENSLGMKLNLIPAGKFLMGSPDTEPNRDAREGPQHEVTITRAFYTGIHEVTVGQFKVFVKETGYKTEAERNGAGAVRRGVELTPGTTWQTPEFAQTDAHPVTCVSWNDAVAFCQWLSKKEGKTYRLPTEAEWEYACRAGSQTPHYFGVDARRLTEHAWIEENSQGATHPVGQLQPNAWGLFDLLGNVSEWCADWHTDDYYANSPKTDPKGPDTGTIRAKRGNGWPHPSVAHRLARRLSIAPDYRSSAGGFRVVCEVRPTAAGDGPKK